MTTASPLSGIRVVDFTHVLAGPYATMLLADAGAEVIKVEPPGGEFVRQRGARREMAPDEWVSAYYLAVNRGKRSLVADLKSADGYRRVRELILQSDVVVENFSPGTLSKLGLDLAELRAEHPRLISASISLFGSSSASVAKSGVARLGLALVAEAETGAFARQMELTGPPVPVSMPLGDMVAGLACFAGITTALVGREHSGTGQHIDISMVQTLLSMNATGMLTHQVAGGDDPHITEDERIRNSATAPYGFYRCQDGLVAIAINNDTSWQSLLVAIGRADLAHDERFELMDERNPRGKEVREIVEARTRDLPKREVLDLMVAHRVPCGLVRQAWELSDDPDLETAGAYAIVDDGFGNHFRTPANPLGFDADHRSVPRLNDYQAVS